MPHEGFADSVMNDGPEFHSNMPVSELTKCVTRAIEASDVSSTPSVAETIDGVTITKMSRPLTGPPLRVGARGKLDSQRDQIKDGNGVVLGWIFVGFGSCGFGFGDDFSPTVFGFGPRNQSGSVSGLVFHP